MQLKQEVQAKIDEEWKSPQQLKKLANEVAYEEKKLGDALAQGTKKAKKGKAAATPVAALQKKPKTPESKDEPDVDVTTILLVFLKPLGGKSKKKKAYAMTLWEDGPNVTPVAQFGKNSFIMKEYNCACDRGELECGCKYCTNVARLSLGEHDTHVAWHDKYRKFVALRKQNYPTVKDMDFSASWNASSENTMLRDLVQLWKQVDPEAPWFRIEANQDKAAAAAAAAAVAAVMAASASASSTLEELNCHTFLISS